MPSILVDPIEVYPGGNEGSLVIDDNNEYDYDNESEYSNGDNVNTGYTLFDPEEEILEVRRDRIKAEYVVQVLIDCKDMIVPSDEVNRGARLLVERDACKNFERMVKEDMIGYYYHEYNREWTFMLDRGDTEELDKSEVLLWLNEEYMNKINEYSTFLIDMRIKYCNRDILR